MERWIRSITGTIPHTNKTVNIDLEGRNLIVTGANGSGKTSFLNEINSKLNALIVKKLTASLDMNRQRLIQWQPSLFQSEIALIENGLQINMPENDKFSALYYGRRALIFLFEEKRLSEIAPVRNAQGLSIEEEEAMKKDFSSKFGNNLEQHLVNLMNRQSLAITKDKDQALADKIGAWFVDFENNLKILFEDDSVSLDFNSDSLHFSIIQKDKPPYSFQTLSAGYRAIFDIYAELIMRTEYFKVMPKELTGVVLIDEIDSHLHVSLQRLILPFFTNSFPNIQFIVTTHSPFVLMSTPDTVVFDLAKNEPVTEDLSYYTYSAVMKGLWDVKPISVALENIVKELSAIINAPQKDYQKLADILEKLKNREDVLDSQSRALVLLGVDILEEAESNV
jgi:predicted ATP-dependent endonuclease of OLD family